MVTQSAARPDAEHAEPRQHPNWPHRAQSVAAFAAAVALVLLYALRGGGSYDLVVYEENGLVIWWILALAIALGLVPRRRPALTTTLLLAALLAYTAWSACSLLWTDSSELTFAEVARGLDYAGVVALAALSLDRRTWRAGAAGLAFGGFLVCLHAVSSRLDPSVFGRDNVGGLLNSDRLTVPFGYWNSVAAWGVMCATIGLAWSAHDSSRVRRAVALGSVPVAAVTTYLTYSRAGVGGAALGLLLVLAVSRHRLTAFIHALAAAGASAVAVAAIRDAPQIARATGTAGASTVAWTLFGAVAACAAVAVLTASGRVDRVRTPRSLFVSIATVGGITVLAAAILFGPHLASKAWHSFTGQTSTGPVTNTNPTARLTNLAGTRYPLWKAMYKAFEAHPLDGIGAGTTQFWWQEHATDPEFVRDAHNIWLQDMAELGLPGLLLIVGVAGSALAVAISARRRVGRRTSAGAGVAFLAAFGVYLLHASVDWMWESTAVTVLAFAGIAVLGARLSGRRMRLAVPFRGAIALLCVGAGVLQLPGMLSTTAVRRSQAAERAGRPALALAWARSAISAEPWSASAYQQKALVQESTGQLAAAAADLHEAITGEPQNYEHWLVLARVDTERGRLDAAAREYFRARELYPLASVFSLAPAR